MRYERGRKLVRILIVLDRILHTKEAPNERVASNKTVRKLLA